MSGHPVLDFPGGLLTDVFLFRESYSRHNSLGPDIRIGEFMFEDAAGNRTQGPLSITNESVLTDCAEEDNVVLSFRVVPEPSQAFLAVSGLLVLVLHRRGGILTEPQRHGVRFKASHGWFG